MIKIIILIFFIVIVSKFKKKNLSNYILEKFQANLKKKKNFNNCKRILNI